MPKPADLEFDEAKIRDWTMGVGQIVAQADALTLEPKSFLREGFLAVSAERLTRRGRIARYRQLYPVRELECRLAEALRQAARRIDARYEQVETELCALTKKGRPSRQRWSTPAKA